MGDIGTKGVPRADRERLLLSAAIEEFGRRGYAGASLTRIASTAGVSKAMVYHLFDSKEAVALAAVEHLGAGLVKAVADAQVSAIPARRALDTLTAIFVALDENRQVWAIIHDTTLPVGSPAAVAAARYRGELALLGTTGSGAVVSGVGVDDRLDLDLIDRIWQSAVATTMRWWQEHDDVSAAEMAERCARMLAILGSS
ncbi:MAG TPA: helix-turn-helix domain-containing protein [Dermatophilaceae bacterium]|nr:helix-turn-helix domain-containing protein [Dermatophilaceae bacterium]HPV80251.1 helix-turn-helix domain-containing protein [Dermatophilaceae bacterium]